MTTATQTNPSRVILDGVPRVGFYFNQQSHDDTKPRCPEDFPFASCLRACLEALGEGLGCRNIGLCDRRWKLGCAYSYLLGVTGIAFKLTWGDGWQPDNCATWMIGREPGDIFVRAFKAVGRDFELLSHDALRPDGETDHTYARRRIVESIRDRRRPVIAHGVVGPPEESIIAGYDDDGDVLIGWSFFQGKPDCSDDLEYEPNGMFRKRDWLKDTWSMILMSDGHKPPPRREVCREALTWALEVIRTPQRFGRANGLAAYDAWADHLLRDDDFATDDIGVLRDRFMAHNDAVSTVAEGRWYGSCFLTEILHGGAINAPELYAAASCLAAEHDLMWKIWGLVGGLGHGETQVHALADPEIRRQMIPIIHAARDKDAEAANHLESALQT